MIAEGLFFAGNTAAGASEDVHMPLIIGALEESGDKIPFLGHRFFAYGTGPLKRIFYVWMTVGTAKDMANSIGFSGEKRGFDLLSVCEYRSAYRTDARFSDVSLSELCRNPFFFVSRSGK